MESHEVAKVTPVFIAGISTSALLAGIGGALLFVVAFFFFRTLYHKFLEERIVGLAEEIKEEANQNKN